MAEPNDPLSERELEILRLVATGAANKEIAHQLVISPNTVKVHVRNIFAKIGVSSRTEATLYAIKIGLIQPGVDSSRTPPLADEGAPLPVDPPGLPSIVIEAGGTTHAGQRALTPARRAMLIGAVVLTALVLLGLGMAGGRLFPGPVPAATAVSQANPQTALSSQRWSQYENLPAPRKGMGAAEYGNAFYLVGGETDQGVDNQLLRYTPAENSWKTLAGKPTAVTDVRAALLGEKIYVPGGRLQDGSMSDYLEVYDPRQDLWETKARLPEPLSAYALAPFEGRLYLFGGKRASTEPGGEISGSVYVYDPQEDSWQERAPLTVPRAFASAAAVSGKILLVGGYDGQNALTLNEAYYPARDASGDNPWEILAPLPAGRFASSVTFLAGTVFVIGGSSGLEDAPLPALQYQQQLDQWSAFESPPLDISEQAVLVPFGNFIFAIGGSSQGDLLAANQSYQAFYTISVPLLQNQP